LIQNALEHALADLGESLVLIVLTNSKINVVTEDEFLKDLHQYFLEPEHLFVLVPIPQRFSRGLKAIESLQELHNEACRFFVDNQTIDGPCIKPKSVRGIVNKLIQEFQDQQYDVIVAWALNIYVQALFNHAPMFRIEPIEQ
jgi:hypothetical protein